MDTKTLLEETQRPAAAKPAQASAPFREALAAPSEELESEQDRPRNRMLGVIIVSTLALLAGIVIGVNEIFRAVFNDEVSTKQLEHQSSELRELRAEEQVKLSRYQWVNRKEGVVRIPVDRARELTLAAYRSRAAGPGEAAPAQGTR